MSRRLIALAAVAATLVLPTGAAAETGSTTTAGKESGSPINDQGSSYHYRTYITSISPSTPGLGIEVLEFADRLLLRNHTGKTVTIYGYSGEPYVRVQPDGTVEQNTRSPATYLNTNFYAQVTVPSSASATAAPHWEVIDRTGQVEWHDHRIHWMSPVTPPMVKDTGRRTKIFDWSVPIAVGAAPGTVRGELFWVPNASSAPVGAIIALAVIIVLAIATVVVVRRRRGGAGATAAPEEREPSEGGREAW